MIYLGNFATLYDILKYVLLQTEDIDKAIIKRPLSGRLAGSSEGTLLIDLDTQP